ncbi:hypothetical protein QJQ45_005969 [Haematococcus lacustris]|nr:hypothetical protein QJQ45_005969 [Haematococcus lacustris]
MQQTLPESVHSGASTCMKITNPMLGHPEFKAYEPETGAGYDPATGRGSLAMEMVCNSVTSLSANGPCNAVGFDNLFRTQNRNVKYVQSLYKGSLHLELNKVEAAGTWVDVNTIRTRDYTLTYSDTYFTALGTNRAQTRPNPSWAKNARACVWWLGEVYLDVKLEGKALGRIVVQLFPDVTVGSARFRDLSIGKEGVGYRLARFDGIFPTYIRCEGATTLSYSATGDSPIAGGASLEALERELEVQSRSHQGPGLVSLVVRDPVERPTQEKLVARNGQLVTMVIEAGGLAANGTTFTITRMPESSLDRTNLIVGQAGGQVLQNSPVRGKVLCKISIRVVEGQDVVDAIGALPFARPRDSYFDGPFFAAAKAMGDKRATTAEKGFNRPLKRKVKRIGESKWRPLELCYWPEQGKLPAKGKEYPGLGYKRVRDKPPKAQQQQPAAAQ